ncbi:MAG: hypothetical protein IOD08_22295 [Bradyrhizobium sp.]|uniref:hypothetical protein n=1 Tax=Bradyrhizobium sp. TaxID=376 RepID=UPI0025C60321|nr:hypothetical protein [Bradyrhizobium sp.]MCA3580005.1 hypothetical protein [Bradyrhizobium sp.]
MTRIVIWGAYPSTLELIRSGSVHIAGFGDDLLWWLKPVLDQLESRGIEIVWGSDVTDDTPLDDALLWLIDFPTPRCKTGSLLLRKIARSRRLLMRLEPPAIAPKAYGPGILDQVGGLLRVEGGPNDERVAHVADFWAPAPLPRNVDGSEDMRSGIVAVSSNKAIVGPRGRLYRFREAAYRALARSECDFRLYGQGWTEWRSGIDLADAVLRRAGIRLPRDPACFNYLGPLDDKAELVRANYSLVIENHLGSRYVSEKPFDSLKLGVMPIYVGGVSFRAIGLGNLVHQVSTIDEIVRCGSLPRPPRRSDVIAGYEAWLESEAGAPFTVDAAAKTVAKVIAALG